MQNPLFHKSCGKGLIVYLFLFSLVISSCAEKVNLPPEIQRVFPEQDSVTVYTFNPYSFSVTATDPEGLTVTVKWDIEGVEVGEGYTINLNLNEQYAGKEIVLTASASDGKRTSTVSWTLQVLSPLYLTHYIMEQVASPSSVSGIFADESLRKWVESHMKTMFYSYHSNYSGQDFDGDGIDDAVFISTRGKPLTAFLELIDTLDNLSSLSDFFQGGNYYRRPLPWVAGGVLPGIPCSAFFTPSSITWLIVSQIFQSISDQSVSHRKYVLSLTELKQNFSISMNSSLNIPLPDGSQLIFYGSLDGEDIVMMVAIEEFISGLWNYMQAYYPDTWRGFISLLFDLCYFEGPWADTDNFPMFSRSITSPSEALSAARENFFYFLYFTSYFLSEVENEGGNAQTFYISQNGTLYTPYVRAGKVLGLNGFDWSLAAQNISDFAQALSSGAPFPLTSLFQTSPAVSDVVINTGELFSAPLPFTAVLPLSVNGESFSEDPASTPSTQLYDLHEPFIDLNFNGTWDPGEPFQDLDGNGTFTDGDSFTDSGWPAGVRDGMYTPRGAFFYETEVPIFYDTGSDNLVPFSTAYPGPDNDGTEGNGLCDTGEPSAGSCSSPSSTTHTWPDGTTVDPDNGVVDYIYFFYPDPTFNGVLAPGTSFDPDGDGTFSNGDINAFFNSIYSKLGSSLRYRTVE